MHFFGKAMLVSFHPIHEKDQKRCMEYGAKLVQYQDLARLEEIIIDWAGVS